jgi:P27 family predicted phage terminase small subunit
LGWRVRAEPEGHCRPLAGHQGTTRRYRGGTHGGEATMPGRKAFAASVHKLRGTQSQVRRAATEQVPGVGSVGEPPDWFTAEQGAVWRHTLGVAPIHVLTGTDRQLLTTWCCAVVDHRTAVRDVQARGQLVNGVANPSLRIANHAAGIILRALAEMGFSPSSRAKLEITPGTGSGNTFAEFAAANE